MNDGIHLHPDWYPGLTEWSSFEEFQIVLQKSPSNRCIMPCECHTAIKGEQCFDRVLWVLKDGLSAHPDWYPGISDKSHFEDVQAVLHRDHQNTSLCSTPCTARPRGVPSLFCFAIIRPTGYEPSLLKVQLERRVGIFDCDDFAVLSDTAFTLGQGPHGAVDTVTFPKTAVGVSSDGTAANTLLFMNAWEAVKKSTLNLQYDWTLKVDPDAVMLPARLRHHLAPYPDQSVYVKNCGAYQGAGWPKMYGALEAFSRRAMSAYFRGAERCRSELDWHPWGEDIFIATCLDHLGVGSISDLDLVSDAACMGFSDCGNWHAAAFHPFKSEDAWLTCWDKVMR